MRQSKRIAECGMIAALCVVVMLVGGYLEIGMYLSPVIAGLLLTYIGVQYGVKYHLTIYIAVSALSFLFVPNIEENLMFASLFGCYPILRPRLQRMKTWPRRICKFLFCNVIVILVEMLIMYVLVPEAMGTAMLIALLILFNMTFACYDFMTPRFYLLMQRYLGKMKR